MYFISPPGKDAALSFAYEELFTRYLRLDEPVFMIWRTGKTVMLGNNQIPDAEADTEYAKENDIKIIRRSSGGGAIYTDKGTVQYTLTEPLVNETRTHREKLAAKIIHFLETLEVIAEQKGRNDILTGDKKISGLAQYTSGKHICTHGSLLYDADIDVLSRVLIAKDEKLLPKGITSVRSRVTNIKPLIIEDLSVKKFIDRLKNHFNTGSKYLSYELSTDDYARIDRIYKEKYSGTAWNLRINNEIKT